MQPPGGSEDAGSGSGGKLDGSDEPDPCEQPADPFATTVLEAGVSYLAADELGGRASNTPGDEATRKYIADAFKCAGLQPAGTDGYQQAFVAPDGTHAANVIGYFPGTDATLSGDIIVVGAHHDHLGIKNSQVYNGANDNASGTISIIAIARAIKAAQPKRTVAFIGFGYEEHDGNCEGSEYYAAHAPAKLPINRTRYMVNLDMVGTYSFANELTIYGASTGSKGRTALDTLAPSYSGLSFVHSGNAAADDSDFQAFADRQVPYVYFETWDEACYHQPCDDAARIDYANMSRIARLGRDVVVTLANNP